jgi:gliding motility-associated-like protein
MSGQQNLVYNGDFEIYSSCPNTISSPGFIEMTKCNGWSNPTDATPDYFNACNNIINGIVGMPYNVAGFQFANSGNAYMGLIPFEYVGNSYWYEYIQGALTTTLQKDKYYNVSFYAVLADGYADVALKNLGAYISQNSFTVSGSQKLNLVPQIKNANYISDTLNWVKVEGVFKALGGESVITIGYFDDITDDTLRINNLPPSGVSSYYYIDGVEVIENSDSISKCNVYIPNVFTPNNDSINDIFIFNTCDKIIKTTIYNRWGNLVFETENNNHNWDGRTTSGEICTDGTYFYIVKTEEKYFKGFVQLVR